MSSIQPARAYLVDLDGTLISSGAPLPLAASLLESIAGCFVVLSNDAEHMPGQLSRKLRAMGLHIPAKRILLAGTTAVDLVSHENPGARTMLLASAALRDHARRRGLTLVDAGADVVVLGRDRHFSYARLESAANAVRAGAQLIVANPDRTHPGKGGTIVPETGSLLSALLACTGDVPFRVVGKPESPMFAAALALLDVDAAEVVMIGDNAETDGLGAARAGIRFLHVDDWAAATSKPAG